MAGFRLLGKHSSFENFDVIIPTFEEESDDDEEPEEATVTAEEMEEWKAGESAFG